ncbi:hypothetical protein [Streptomyces sp. NPDC056527]|uniref:hypothetical protein n=1 Tax=Streptomyces sp. NPDC056527 TaxID=3345853 RepID=UPI003698CCD0
MTTGIEDPFLTAYKEGSFHYLMIVADRIWARCVVGARISACRAPTPVLEWPHGS